MSSSICIPKRKHPMTTDPSAHASTSTSTSSASSSLSLSSSTPHTSQMNSLSPSSPSSSPSKGEWRPERSLHTRRVSLLSESHHLTNGLSLHTARTCYAVETELETGEKANAGNCADVGSSLSAQEHTVINVGHPDGPPRLITCVKASQGFDWNQEIFLPSHAHSHSSASDYPDLERRKDPVHEIVLTDEELKNMFPQ